MKKHCLLILFCSLLAIFVQASPTDSISTTYSDGEFVTYCRVWVNASDSTSNTVTRDFDYQMRYKLDALFSWALKGMNLRKEKNELMMFYFKSTSFNKETNVLRGIGDAIVPGIITVPDVIVDSRLTSKKFANGRSAVYIDLLSANGFIKNMNCSFGVVPKKEKGVWYTLETRVKFGWFFNLFITQSRYKQIMEWRLKRFVHNLKDEAEKRERRERKTPNP